MRSQVKKYYDEKYEEFQEESFIKQKQHLFNLGIDYDEIVRMYRMINSTEGTVLDLGCGGQPSSYIFSQSSTSQIVGVDISKTGLKHAEHGAQFIGYPGIFYPVVGDGLHLPFKDETFDSIVLYTSLEYMDKPQEVIGEVGRVLKKGGNVFICTLNKKYLVRKLIRLVKRDHWSGDMFPQEPCFTLKEMETWFKQNSLSIQGHFYAFNYVSAFWDVFILPRMIKRYLNNNKSKVMFGSLKVGQFILSKIAILDKLFKRIGDSSVLVVVGRKEV